MDNLPTPERDDRGQALAGRGLLLAAVAVWLLGSVALLGRHLPWSSLPLVPPGEPYAVAGLIVLGGAGLALLGLRRQRTALLAAGALCTVALAGVAVEVLRTVRQAHGPAPRPSPTDLLAAWSVAPGEWLAFCLAGAALALLALAGPHRPRLLLGVRGVACATIALATLGFAAGDPGIRGALPWMAWLRMASASAVALCVLGSALLAWLWLHDTRPPARSPCWLPQLVGAAVLIVTVIAWLGARSRDHQQVDRTIRGDAERMARHVSKGLERKLRFVEQYADHWAVQDIGRQQGQQELWHVQQVDRNLLGIVWIDAGGIVQRSDGEQGLGPEFPSHAPLSARLWRELQLLTGTDQMHISDGVVLPSGDRGLVAFLPAFHGLRFNGWIAVVFDKWRLFESLLDERTTGGYSVLVRAYGYTVYELYYSDQQQAPNWTRGAAFRVLGVPWALRIWPDSATLARLHSRVPDIVLGVGVLIALLLASVTRLAQAVRQRAREAESAHNALAEEMIERELAVAALQTSQASLAQAQRIAHLGSWDWDLLAGTQTWSDEMFRVFGLNPETCEPSYEEFVAAVHPQDRDEVTRAIAGALRGEQQLELLHRIVRPDGSERVVNEQALVFSETTGTPVRMLGIVQDITERHRVQVALCESEERFRYISQGTPYPLFITRKSDSRILFGNQAFIETYGLSGRDITELYGKDLYDDPAVRETVMQQMEQDGFARTQEFLQRRANGELFWALATRQDIAYNGIPAVMVALMDITDRVSAEQRLRAERNFINSIFETAGALLVVLDPEGHILRFNKACEDLSGYRFAQVQHALFWDVVLPPEQRAATREAYLRLVANAGKRARGRFEDDWLSQNGSRHRISWSNSVITDERGAVLFVIGSGIDVTHRIAAETALRKSERSLAKAQQIAGIGSWELDFGSGRMHWTEQCFRILGLTPQPHPLSYEEFLALVAPDDVPALQAAVDNALRLGRPYDIDIRVLHRDGSPRTVNAQGEVIHAGDAVVGLIGTIQDITERKRAEQALRESTARLRAVITSAPVILFAFDVNHNMIFADGRGVDRLQAAAGILNDMGALSAYCLSNPDFRASLELALQGGASGCEVTLAGIPFETRFSPVADAYGQVHSAIGVAIDISERRRIDLMKNEFVSMVSHELRTPLTSIRGSLGLIVGGAAGAIPPAAASLLEIAQSNTERLMRLITDILDLDRMESGRMAMHIEHVSAAGLVDTALSGLAAMVAEAQVELLQQADETLLVSADRDRIVQVLINLAGNAIKFSPPRSRVLVCVSASDGQRVRFAVVDEGPGISTADQSRLFAKFQQLDATDARTKGGTGLGLAISKAIVENHDGTIWVESVPGRGSTFVFELPGVGPEVGEYAVPAASGAKILLVTDSADSGGELEHALSAQGHRVQRVGTLAAARLLLATARPDMVLMHAAGAEAFEALTALHRDARTRDVPVMIVAPHSPPPSLGLGPLVVDYIADPCADDDLLRAVHRALPGRRRPNVLVVNGDPTLRGAIVACLRRAHLHTLETDDAQQAPRLIAELAPELLLVDARTLAVGPGNPAQILCGENSRRGPPIIYTGPAASGSDRAAWAAGMTYFVSTARVPHSEVLRTLARLVNGLCPGRPRAPAVGASITAG